MEKPTLPKGTRDFGPAQMARRDYIFRNIREVFQLYGFQPLETPAMENLSTLTGKYGEEGDQLLFRILNSGDFLKDTPSPLLEGKISREVSPYVAEKGLRYDLTVPFARYVVMNRHEITFPFKRYQMQPVWRADRPQKGRYREFYQCDADVVGTDSLVCEVEIIQMIRDVFSRLKIVDYTIKLNHRGILSAMAVYCGAAGNEASMFVAIDKLDKIGKEKVQEELLARGFNSEGISRLFQLLELKGSTTEKLQQLQNAFGDNESAQKSLNDLKQVLSLLKASGSDDRHVEFDLSLARGLSYYTGCIFEVSMHGAGIGSVSGGGRYDNLTAVFDARERSSGVGISFGVDRIYDGMETLGLFPEEARIGARVLICHMDAACFNAALSLTTTLRQAGLSAETYPDESKIKKQFEYADKKGIPYVVVIGSDELKSGEYALKDLRSGVQEKVKPEGIIARIQASPR